MERLRYFAMVLFLLVGMVAAAQTTRIRTQHKVAKGEKTAIKEMRAHACWYVSTLPNANRCKAKINFMNTMADLEKIMSEYRNAISTDDFVYFMEDDRI